MITCDYLVVGGGTAGAVAASRLSENPANRVVLVEAGADIRPDAVPADIRDIFPLSTFNPSYVWPDLRVHWRGRDTSPAVGFQQGKVLGGGSSVMGMWAVRGMPEDYEGWREAGAEGWSWSDVLPWFRHLETDHDFAGAMHGADGPLPIRRQKPDEWSPLAHAMQRIANDDGLPDIEDMNADFRDGHCVLPISRHETRRASAGLDYLTSAVRARPNLQVLTGTAAERLIVEGTRVVGASLRTAQADPVTIRAGHTILAAGAIYSPALLQRSGIGAGDRLAAAGITVHADRPGIGQNLQNHPFLPAVAWLARSGRDAGRGRPPASTYLRWSSGVDGGFAGDMGMYVRSYLVWHALGRHMAMVGPVLMRPASRGSVDLNLADPMASPSVAFEFLSDPSDLQRMMDGFRRAARYLADPRLKPVCGEAFMLTNAAQLGKFNAVSAKNAVLAKTASLMLDVAPALGKFAISRFADMVPLSSFVQDDDLLAQFILGNIGGTNHVAGTCRMGHRDDPLAVVDNKGQLYGVDGLTVADASVMPTVPSGNTHIPTVMVAEKIVHGLRGGK
jgi:5-(hydroxymethyl)furfural/furfural oxidase